MVKNTKIIIIKKLKLVRIRFQVRYKVNLNCNHTLITYFIYPRIKYIFVKLKSQFIVYFLFKIKNDHIANIISYYISVFFII